MTCLIKIGICAKIAMVFMKDISYSNTYSNDRNIENIRKAGGASLPGLRANGFLEKRNPVWQD
jgi:hypothetical protein